MTRNIFVLGAFGACLIALVSPGLVVAQAFPGDRGFNAGVDDSFSEAYGPLGLRLGAFQISPEIAIGLASSDNIFKTTRGTSAEEWTVRPAFQLRSDWSRHAVFANGSVERITVPDFSAEDRTNSTGGLGGRLDLGPGSLTASMQFTSGAEERGAAGASSLATKPTEFSDATYLIGGTAVLNRWKLGASATWLDRDFKDVPRAGGGVIDQDFRDTEETTYVARVDYAISPAASVFAEATFGENTFPNRAAATNRDSDSVNTLVGASFDITRLVRGEVAIGQMERNYKAARFRDQSDLSYRANVQWFPTRLWTFTGGLTKRIAPAEISAAAGADETVVSLTADYAFRRNIRLTAQYSRTDTDYDVVDREDKRTTSSGRITYYQNRVASWQLEASRSELASSGAARTTGFEDNRLVARLVLRR